MLNASHPITKFLTAGDMTVADLANRVGYSAATIYRWIDCSRRPSARAMEALDKASRGSIAPTDIIRFYRLHEARNSRGRS